MIYLVTSQASFINSETYKIIDIKKSIELLKHWDIIQCDTETNGTFAKLDKLLCVQFGNDDKTIQIVIDCSTINIRYYKEILESKYLIFQNGKFDLQFFYNYNIVPRKIYDTMIVEQLLHLGYPSGTVSYSLKAIAKRRLGIDIDKTIRGQIIWRGLDEKVIEYAASDVVYLYDIMKSQINDCKRQGCIIGAKLECDAVPAIAYLEWCGIKLDIDKWKNKMIKDKKSLEKAVSALNDFIIKLSKEGYKRPTKDDIGNTFYEFISPNTFSKYLYIDRQGDLFNGFSLEPKVTINWSSPIQVVEIAKILGFNTIIKNKKTGEDSDSVIEKQLRGQKGICDEFLNLYFDYQEYKKVVTSFGQGHLNAVCPVDGRIHTIYKQLGAASGK